MPNSVVTNGKVYNNVWYSHFDPDLYFIYACNIILHVKNISHTTKLRTAFESKN